MITIHIDTQKDTNFLVHAYKGLTDNKVMVNPSRKEVEDVLRANPTERVMLMGHGSPCGLFASDWKDGDVIDSKNAYLLKGREVIGIWCYAESFARQHGLMGFFTNMFISNIGEYKSILRSGNATEQEVYDGVVTFSKMVNSLIADGTPLDEWCDILRDSADLDIDFVRYNYNGLKYYDGTQKANIPTYIGYSNGRYNPYYDEDYRKADDDAEDSCKDFLLSLDYNDFAEMTMSEVIAYAYTEGFKAGRF